MTDKTKSAVAVKPNGKIKQTAAPVTKKKAKKKGKKKGGPGGAREGAGRSSLHPGKDTEWHATAYFTASARQKLAEVQKELLRRNKNLNQISVSDAIEEGIHRLHRELTRPR